MNELQDRVEQIRAKKTPPATDRHASGAVVRCEVCSDTGWQVTQDGPPLVVQECPRGCKRGRNAVGRNTDQRSSITPTPAPSRRGGSF